MFSYNRDEMAAPAVRRALASDSTSSKPRKITPEFVCRQIGRALIGWLTAIIVIQVAVKYFAGN